jgi:hypothetical protein
LRFFWRKVPFEMGFAHQTLVSSLPCPGKFAPWGGGGGGGGGAWKGRRQRCSQITPSLSSALSPPAPSHPVRPRRPPSPPLPCHPRPQCRWQTHPPSGEEVGTGAGLRGVMASCHGDDTKPCRGLAHPACVDGVCQCDWMFLPPSCVEPLYEHHRFIWLVLVFGTVAVHGVRAHPWVHCCVWHANPLSFVVCCIVVLPRQSKRPPPPPPRRRPPTHTLVQPTPNSCMPPTWVPCSDRPCPVPHPASRLLTLFVVAGGKCGTESWPWTPLPLHPPRQTIVLLTLVGIWVAHRLKRRRTKVAEEQSISLSDSSTGGPPSFLHNPREARTPRWPCPPPTHTRTRPTTTATAIPYPCSH